MDISRYSGEGCINVGMSINPDDTEIWAVLGVAANGTYCQAAKNKYNNLQGLLLGKQITSANIAYTLPPGQSQGLS